MKQVNVGDYPVAESIPSAPEFVAPIFEDGHGATRRVSIEQLAAMICELVLSGHEVEMVEYIASPPRFGGLCFRVSREKHWRFTSAIEAGMAAFRKSLDESQEVL